MSIQKLKDLLKEPPKNANLNAIGTDATTMPDECIKLNDSVASYRKYYIMKKNRFATWKQPAVVPQWYADGLEKFKQEEKHINKSMHNEISNFVNANIHLINFVQN